MLLAVKLFLVLVLIIKGIDHEAKQNEQGRQQAPFQRDGGSDAPQKSGGQSDAGRNPSLGSRRGVL